MPHQEYQFNRSSTVFVPEVVGVNTVSQRMSRKVDELTISRQQEASRGKVRVATLYKRKKDKVRPVNEAATNREAPRGLVNQKVAVLAKYRLLALPVLDLPLQKGKLTPKFSKIARRARLTPEREEKLLISKDLRPKERELLVEILFNRKEALAQDFSKIGRIRPEVVLPQEIRIVNYKAQQILSFAVLKALNYVVAGIVKERV